MYNIEGFPNLQQSNGSENIQAFGRVSLVIGQAKLQQAKGKKKKSKTSNEQTRKKTLGSTAISILFLSSVDRSMGRSVNGSIGQSSSSLLPLFYFFYFYFFFSCAVTRQASRTETLRKVKCWRTWWATVADHMLRRWKVCSMAFSISTSRNTDSRYELFIGTCSTCQVSE
jgi:hypothetical protein